jgi:hypothetical protein
MEFIRTGLLIFLGIALVGSGAFYIFGPLLLGLLGMAISVGASLLALGLVVVFFEWLFKRR